jgi:flagellar hook-associated protein 3 FlgL
MNRVTSLSGQRILLADLQQAQQAMLARQRAVATGKRIQVGSDAPADTVAALAHRAELRRSAQLQRNADRARDWLVAADRVTSGLIDELNRARDLLVQANSGAADTTARTAISQQLGQIRLAVLGIANTTVLGRPVLGGTTDSLQAYDSSGTYVGDTGSVALPVSPGLTLDVSRTGPQVLGISNPTDPANGDVLELLAHLSTVVAVGDTSAIGDGLARLDAALTRVQTAQTELGSRLRQLDDLAEANRMRDAELQMQVSDLEDIDVAETAVELKAREFAYQSALAVSARVMQLSLLDFLR